MKPFFLLLLVGFSSATVLQHKMVHVESAMKQMLREGTWRRVIETRRALRAVTSQRVNDQYDVEYLSNITIGTPQKTYLALLDTGSADLFVYDDMGGGLQRDIVRLGGVDETQLVVPDTSFYRLKPDPFSGSGFGVVGLAFPAVSTNNTIPILINAINQGLLDQPLFTVFLIHNPVVGGYGGTFTYGGIDTENCEDIIAYQPLSSATFYQFRMTAVLFGDYTVTKNWDVISDTGTSFIMAPQVQSDAIANVAGGQWDDWNEIYWIDCGKTFPDLVLTIGSRQYSIQSANLVVPAGDDENCLLALAPYDPAGFGASWILGDPVIRQYCHIYDIGNQRIGFATPKSAL